nr:unnamed protein product [Callosobruchus analis]
MEQYSTRQLKCCVNEDRRRPAGATTTHHQLSARNDRPTDRWFVWSFEPNRRTFAGPSTLSVSRRTPTVRPLRSSVQLRDVLLLLLTNASRTAGLLRIFAGSFFLLRRTVQDILHVEI